MPWKSYPVPRTVCRCGSPVPIAAAHEAGVNGAELVMLNTIPGDGSGPASAGVPTNVRLLVSPVNPSSAQVGAAVVPLCTVVRTVTDEPALNVASEPLASPKMLNSASVQPAARLRMVSEFDVPNMLVPPVHSVMVSLPAAAAVPPSFRLIRFAIAWCGTGA